MSGVDTLNQFPNSRMAQAVKVGQSRIYSPDAPSIAVGQQPNVSIAASTLLTVPATATYAVIQAIGGPLYYTIDGTTPSATNFAGSIAAGSSVPFYGQGLLTALKVIGTQMSVEYMR